MGKSAMLKVAFKTLCAPTFKSLCKHNLTLKHDINCAVYVRINCLAEICCFILNFPSDFRYIVISTAI